MKKMLIAGLVLLAAIPAFAAITQDFEGAAFPPAGWSLAGTGNLYSRSTLCSGYGVGAASVKADFYNNSAGTTQDLVTILFSAANATDSLKFDHAYATYGTEVDSLKIYTSTNGGGSWTLLIGLAGGRTGPLNTYGGAGYTTASFVPTAAQWATKRYTLPVNTNKIRFTARSAYGNNLYLDNIKISCNNLLHDVGVTAINTPKGFVHASVAVTPQTVVNNMGASVESFNTTLRIDQVGGGNVYNQTSAISNLAAGASQTVTFPGSWTPAYGFSYNITTYTQLGTDLNIANDTLKKATICGTQRKQLVEYYTCSSCPPCVGGNTALDAVWEKEQRDISIIRTHVWWPTNNDPMYLGRGADTMENRARVTYYSITGVPACYVNGVVSSNYQTSVDSYIDTTSFELKLSGWYMPASDTGRIKATMIWHGPKNDGNPKATYILRYAVVEDSIAYTGTNGDPNHNQVLRDMFPNNTGITVTINQGQTVADSQKFTVYSGGSHPYTWDEPRLSVIVYVQDNATKAVINSQNILLSELPATMLGVELSEFTGMVENGAVTLNWRTGSETDNYMWLIERSTTPDNGFVRIAEVQASNEPNGNSYSYTDDKTAPLTDYYYRLGDQDLKGNIVWHGPVLVTSRGEVITSVSLAPCRPNPCSQGASIAYGLPKADKVSLNVYDVTGRLVRTLESGVKKAGSHQAAWDLKNNSGRKVANGIYMYRLIAGNQTRTQKLTVIR